MTHCIASKKTTKVRVYQLKDDGTVFKEFKDQSIVIHRPTVDNTGEYMCEATNSAGRIEYRFNIEVIGKFIRPFEQLNRKMSVSVQWCLRHRYFLETCFFC